MRGEGVRDLDGTVDPGLIDLGEHAAEEVDDAVPPEQNLVDLPLQSTLRLALPFAGEVSGERVLVRFGDVGQFFDGVLGEVDERVGQDLVGDGLLVLPLRHLPLDAAPRRYMRACPFSERLVPPTSPEHFGDPLTDAARTQRVVAQLVLEVLANRPLPGLAGDTGTQGVPVEHRLHRVGVVPVQVRVRHGLDDVDVEEAWPGVHRGSPVGEKVSPGPLRR